MQIKLILALLCLTLSNFSFATDKPPLTIKHLTFLADNGNPKAQARLAFLYYEGKEIPQDYKKAINLYKKAAKQGLPAAQSELALMYNIGLGEERNNMLACMWLIIARQNGGHSSDKLLFFISTDLTKAQIHSANQMAITCLKSNYKDCPE